MPPPPVEKGIQRAQDSSPARRITPGEQMQQLIDVAYQLRKEGNIRAFHEILTQTFQAKGIVDDAFRTGVTNGLDHDALRALEVPETDIIIGELYTRYCAIDTTTSPQLPNANNPQLP